MKFVVDALRAGDPPLDRKLRVTVLAGGPGAERAVSLDTGRAVADALRHRGHEVHVADIAPNDLSALDRPADIVFPALHGTFGEDGTLQRILEDRHVPFVGSGSKASAIAIDKVAAKELARELGMYTPPCEIITPANLQRKLTRLPMPVVAKPIREGSSVSTFIVRERAELEPALREILDAYERALVERYIDGEEITVGILGREALPPICIRPKRQFYDYQAKYQDDATEYLFDAGHPQGLLDDVSNKSLELYERMGCRHLARIDWMLDREGRLWFLEVNTLPGFTSHSLVPKAAERVGIGFDELVERLAFMAVGDA